MMTHSSKFLEMLKQKSSGLRNQPNFYAGIWLIMNAVLERTPDPSGEKLLRRPAQTNQAILVAVADSRTERYDKRAALLSGSRRNFSKSVVCALVQPCIAGARRPNSYLV